MINFQQLHGKTIAIAGASRGIGKETAELLGSLGANLILGGRDETELKKVASAIQSFEAGGRLLSIKLDVTDEQSVRCFLEASVQEFGTVDVIINSAGTGVFSSVFGFIH